MPNHRNCHCLGPVVAGLLLAAALPVAAVAQAPPPAAGPQRQLIEDLVAANRILADQGVLDGFGHVSVRHPEQPNRLLLSRSLAPALTTADDIMEYDLDCAPVAGSARPSF